MRIPLILIYKPDVIKSKNTFTNKNNKREIQATGGVLNAEYWAAQCPFGNPRPAVEADGGSN
jgi:hypothetical protein